MGSDFSFIVLAKKDSKKAIEEYINSHSDEKINLDSEKYLDLAINFPLDSFILKYFEGGYRPWIDNSTFDYVEYNLRHEYKARIGCITLSEKNIDDPDICKYRFTAVTNSMSYLFEESLSIRKWFVELGKISSALMVYMDLEYNGNRIIYFNGKEADILLKGDSHYYLTADEFCASMEMFAKAQRGYFHDENYLIHVWEDFRE